MQKVDSIAVLFLKTAKWKRTNTGGGFTSSQNWIVR